MRNRSLRDGKIWEGKFGFVNEIFEKLNLYAFTHSEQQRAQRVFKAAQPMDLPAARNKLLGFGMQLLDGIDPNPDNMVCAGIIHTQGQQVGCLLRLEPNRQAQVSAMVINYFVSTIPEILRFRCLNLQIKNVSKAHFQNSKITKNSKYLISKKKSETYAE